MIARLQLWALIGLAFVAGILGIYRAGARAGVDQARRKLDEKRLADIRKARGVQNEIEILDDSGLADRASRWLRNDD